MRSPLRYPGGKARHIRKILQYFDKNEPDYREPFVGGGSVFLGSEFSSGWINDIDPEIFDLWRLVKESPNTLITLIKEHSKILDHKKDTRGIEQAINLWRTIKNGEGDFPLGYRALFLTKTCFNGVKSGGPTGGLHQTGKYSLFSRWAPEMTIRRINAAHERLRNITVTNLSYQDVIKENNENTCYYFDPPYLEKGKQCYDYFFTLKDHEEFAKNIARLSARYVVTVDDCEELREIWTALVPKNLIISEEWFYSMSDYRDENKVGKEMFIVDQHSYNVFKSKKSTTKIQREY